MPQKWHETPLEKILAALGTNPERGLSASEVSERLKKFGENMLPRGKKTHWWEFLIRQFRSPLVYILVIAAILSGWLEEFVDMTVILCAVGLNVLVGFWQEFRSSNILEKLQSYVHASALVLRDGTTKEIDATTIVPGDILILKTGAQVPADARLISASHLELDEAVLTGESVPVHKEAAATVATGAVVGDRKNMVHMGTTVARGEAVAVVVATASRTELGTIALLTAKTEEEETPLQKRIGRLGNILTIIIAISSVMIFFVGILEHHSLLEMFTTTVAVAVAAIPEGLPAAISIVLAVAASRVLKHKGVVKKLVAAETLGSASIICADKTGTLTEGRMVVEKLVTEDADDRARLILALANEAVIEPSEKAGEPPLVRGEITDQAKMREFMRAGGNLDKALQDFPRRSLFPFDPDLKYLASLHRTREGGGVVFVSGAPEALLELSAFIRTAAGSRAITEEDRVRLKRQYEQLAGNGFRTIAVAERILSDGAVGDGDLQSAQTRKDAIHSLSYVGLAAIRDPIRADVKDSIKVAREAGMRVMMLTGDHILTAQSIGAELGFRADQANVLSGQDIEHMDDTVLADHLTHIEICARVSPEHKLRIVNALQKADHVVAMTGDGVNDAPALKTANIGVALGSGTDVAKEASDLILLDNSFTTIVSAIRQGRIAFDNIRKVAVFLLMQSFTELLLILASLLFGLPLPFTAAMILWTNLVEDALPNIALSFEPGEKDVMRRPPLKKNEPILDKESAILVFLIGLMNDIILVAIWVVFDEIHEYPLEYLRTLVFFAVGIDSFFYIYGIKSLRQPIWRTNLLDNPYLTGATVIGVAMMFAGVYSPFFNSILGSVPLTFGSMMMLFCFGLFKISVVELAKWRFIQKERTLVTPEAPKKPSHASA